MRKHRLSLRLCTCCLALALVPSAPAGVPQGTYLCAGDTPSQEGQTPPGQPRQVRAKVQTGQSDASADRSISFVVWGHSRGDSDGTLPHHSDEILERIKELDVDFMILTGDMIFGQWGRTTVDPRGIRADWERLDNTLDSLGIPVYRTPGNHDVHNLQTRDLFLERYPKPPTAFTHQGSRFILLDSVGIDQRGEQQGEWGSPGLPLDEAQIAFLREELVRQEQYSNIFLFLHHSLWREASAPWWQAVHPLLRGSKTRAVFSGNPFRSKYEHMQVDGIHHIESAVLNRRGRHALRANADERAIARQLDNFQHVKVNGSEYTIETIVVGALASDYLSPLFWQEIERPRGWTDYVAYKTHQRFATFGELMTAAGFGAGICFAGGVLATALWHRWRAGCLFRVAELKKKEPGE